MWSLLTDIDISIVSDEVASEGAGDCADQEQEQEPGASSVILPPRPPPHHLHHLATVSLTQSIWNKEIWLFKSMKIEQQQNNESADRWHEITEHLFVSDSFLKPSLSCLLSFPHHIHEIHPDLVNQSSSLLLPSYFQTNLPKMSIQFPELKWCLWLQHKTICRQSGISRSQEDQWIEVNQIRKPVIANWTVFSMNENFSVRHFLMETRPSFKPSWYGMHLLAHALAYWTTVANHPKLAYFDTTARLSGHAHHIIVHLIVSIIHHCTRQ